MTIHVHSARVGWATNSSSTHSILVLPEGHAQVEDHFVEGNEFGWQTFTAASVRSKIAWLSCCLAEQAVRRLGSLGEGKAGKMHAIELLQQVGVAEDLLPSMEDWGYVDHQSRLDLPLEDYGVSAEMLKEVVALLMDPRVVITGGNDNDEQTHPLDYNGDAIDYSLWKERNCQDPFPRIRKDKRDNYWSAFDKGVTRFRWAADPGPAIIRAEVPELVDLSIGNRCSFGCKYCYRGSTSDQGYASQETVSRILSQLAMAGVFEVALGGGEPMQHPDLLDILGLAPSGLALHITTRDLSWLKVPQRRRPILQRITAFGFSVDTEAAARKALDAFDAEGITDRLNLQVVVGAIPEARLRKILDAAQLAYARVTLLGYKTTGFGSNVKPHKVSPDVLKGRYQIGIDSVLAKQWAPWLKKHHVWQGCYDLQEGAFSCYIDAEKQTLHRSSFDASEGISIVETRYPGASYQRIEATSDAILRAYQSMQTQAGIS